MKLEFKHLASYLPYGLNIKDVKHGSVFEALHFITTPHQDFSLFKGNLDQLINDKYLKPILFPLSQFVKFTFSEEVEECLLNYSADFILNQTNRLPYFIIQEFLSNKIDVFGLIEAGLAEPVTEDFNPYK